MAVVVDKPALALTIPFAVVVPDVIRLLLILNILLTLIVDPVFDWKLSALNYPVAITVEPCIVPGEVSPLFAVINPFAVNPYYAVNALLNVTTPFAVKVDVVSGPVDTVPDV